MIDEFKEPTYTLEPVKVDQNENEGMDKDERLIYLIENIKLNLGKMMILVAKKFMLELVPLIDQLQDRHLNFFIDSEIIDELKHAVFMPNIASALAACNVIEELYIRYPEIQNVFEDPEFINAIFNKFNEESNTSIHLISFFGIVVTKSNNTELINHIIQNMNFLKFFKLARNTNPEYIDNGIMKFIDYIIVTNPIDILPKKVIGFLMNIIRSGANDEFIAKSVKYITKLLNKDPNNFPLEKFLVEDGLLDIYNFIEEESDIQIESYHLLMDIVKYYGNLLTPRFGAAIRDMFEFKETNAIAAAAYLAFYCGKRADVCESFWQAGLFKKIFREIADKPVEIRYNFTLIIMQMIKNTTLHRLQKDITPNIPIFDIYRYAFEFETEESISIALDSLTALFNISSSNTDFHNMLRGKFREEFADDFDDLTMNYNDQIDYKSLQLINTHHLFDD